MASVNDKITDVRNSARPNSARVSSGRSSGGTTLACDNLSGWPTASKVHFVTYQLDSNSNPVAGSQLDCYGIVSGNNIGSFTVVDGSDNGNSVGNVVEILPTAAWGQDLADALSVVHERTGALKSGISIPSPTITTPTIASFVNATHTHANAAGGGQIANAGISGLSTTKLANDYKFSVWRSAALTYGSPGVVPFDVKVFDTGSNVDIVTNKGRFTAPIAGFYWFNANFGFNSSGSGFIGYLYKNGAQTLQGASTIQSGVSWGSSLNVMGLMQLAANDYVEAAFYGSGTAATVGQSVTYFQGFLVSQT